METERAVILGTSRLCGLDIKDCGIANVVGATACGKTAKEIYMPTPTPEEIQEMWEIETGTTASGQPASGETTVIVVTDDDDD